MRPSLLARPSLRIATLLTLLASAGAAAAEHQVEMKGMRFAPAQLTIQQGDTVRWRNTTAVVHTVTADPARAKKPENVSLPQGAQPFSSGSVQPGQEYSRTFDVPGEYTYFCIPHQGMGMVAHITVQPAK